MLNATPIARRLLVAVVATCSLLAASPAEAAKPAGSLLEPRSKVVGDRERARTARFDIAQIMREAAPAPTPLATAGVAQVPQERPDGPSLEIDGTAASALVSRATAVSANGLWAGSASSNPNRQVGKLYYDVQPGPGEDWRHCTGDRREQREQVGRRHRRALRLQPRSRQERLREREWLLVRARAVLPRLRVRLHARRLVLAPDLHDGLVVLRIRSVTPVRLERRRRDRARLSRRHQGLPGQRRRRAGHHLQPGEPSPPLVVRVPRSGLALPDVRQHLQRRGSDPLRRLRPA